MRYKSLEEMRQVDPRTVDRASLVERSSIRLNPDDGYEDRLRDYVRQMGNPYCYLDGGVIVKLTFREKGPSIEEQINSVYLAGA